MKICNRKEGGELGMKRVVGRVERRRNENINCRVNEEETEKEKKTFLPGKYFREICYLFIMFGFSLEFYDAFPFVLDGTATHSCSLLPCCTSLN
jgi:hypothetical protein